MNSPDTYIETQQSSAQATIGRLRGVEELGTRCRQYVFCHQDDALLDVMGSWDGT